MKHILKLIIIWQVISFSENTLLGQNANFPSGAHERQAQEIKGIDLGGKTMKVFVARDKTAWEAVKQAVGKPQEVPVDMPKPEGLERLDGIDFQKQMIVAVFWGEVTFSGHNEKCWIEGISIGKEEIAVNCHATLWGGQRTASWSVWPYHAEVVSRSDLPVQFKQTTESRGFQEPPEKIKTQATLKKGEWQLEVPMERPL